MSAATTQFPTATILAYPRIGRQRQLKRALEAYWPGAAARVSCLKPPASYVRRTWRA